ncbi:Vacuolar membrane protease [Smittium mucronatum]|uniref:Peptide hydrolase n=1 Tax=Smittium mucronatum TaxID=133383 RepID=A0A1R0GL54_9FUNG|nr:Vacuolar membrane protease [Smittium mucronatum]
MKNRKAKILDSSKNSEMRLSESELDDGLASNSDLLEQESHSNKIFVPDSSIWASILHYLAISLVYFFLVLIVYLTREYNMKYSPPDNNYVNFSRLQISYNSTPPIIDSSYFRADAAYAHLIYLARGPHPWNSQVNDDNLIYIANVLKQIQELAQTSGVEMEIISDDPTAFSVVPSDPDWIPGLNQGSNEKSGYFVEGRNVLARIIGTNGDKDNAILVSSHVDSVQVSFGATDDGISVSTMLEMARHLIFNRLKSTVVFNFNNGEEIGLFGALAFMHHPWSQTIKAFINMEGAGAGGPAMVFRASNYDLIREYGKRQPNSLSKWNPNCNVFANDAFKLGLINSDTDYSVYSAYGIPGLDLAFYQRRALYHTNRDNTRTVPLGSINQIGNTVLSTLKSLSENQDLMSAPRGNTNSSSVYYDVLGRSVVTHSFTTLYILYGVLLFLIPVSSILIKWTSKNYKRKVSFVPNSRKDIDIYMHKYIPYSALVYGILFTALALILSIVFSYILGLVLQKANYFVVYGHLYLVVFTHFFLNILAVSLVMLLYMHVCGRSAGSRFLMSRILTYSQMFIWWVAVLIGLVLAAIKGVGMFYYTIYYSFFCLVAVFWTKFIDPMLTKKFEYFSFLGRALLAICVPSIFSIDLTMTLAFGMGQTVIDGTSPSLVHLLFGLFTTTIVIPCIPFLVVPGKKRLFVASVVFFMVFLSLLLVSLVIKPFSYNSPSHVYFNGDINMQTKVENMTLLANDKFDYVSRILNSFKTNSTLSSYENKKGTSPERYSRTYLGDNGFSKSLKANNITMPSYNITKSIPNDFLGPTTDKSNGMFISISAQAAYICELRISNPVEYAYVVPQFLDTDFGAGGNMSNVLQSNSTESISPLNNSRFNSYVFPSAEKGCCQSTFMISKFRETFYQVYVEKINNGELGNIMLQCHYGYEYGLIIQVSSLLLDVAPLDVAIGSFHSSTGILSVTTKVEY